MALAGVCSPLSSVFNGSVNYIDDGGHYQQSTLILTNKIRSLIRSFSSLLGMKQPSFKLFVSQLSSEQVNEGHSYCVASDTLRTLVTCSYYYYVSRESHWCMFNCMNEAGDIPSKDWICTWQAESNARSHLFTITCMWQLSHGWILCYVSSTCVPFIVLVMHKITSWACVVPDCVQSVPLALNVWVTMHSGVFWWSCNPVADPGFLEGGFWCTIAHENLEATPTLGQNHAPFDRFLRQTISPTSPIDPFSNEFSSKAF